MTTSPCAVLPHYAAQLRRRPTRYPLLLLLLCTLAACINIVCAESCIQPHPISEVSPVHHNRIHSLSDESLTAKRLQKDPELKQRIQPAFDLLDTLSGVVKVRRGNNSPDACNLPFDIEWVNSGKRRVQIFQLGEYTSSCYSMVDVAKAESKGEVNAGLTGSVKHTLREATRALYTAINESRVPLPSNWTKTYELIDWDVRRSLQTCTIETIYAYRMSGTWFIRAGMTNLPINEYVADWKRDFVQEWVPRNSTQSIKSCQPNYFSEKEDDLEVATTLISRWGGPSAYGTTADDGIDDNPSAIGQAYRNNLVDVDLASDSVTVSNIAILALPMAMSLIPLAFVADLNSAGMLIYVLITDIFSTIPFIVKGFELMRSSAPRQQVVLSYHMGNSTLGQVEIYAAECHADESFRVTGIIFVTVGFCLMIGGVILEFIARRVMEKRRELNENAKGPFGTALMEETTLGLLGQTENELHDEYRRRFSEELDHSETRPPGLLGRRWGIMGRLQRLRHRTDPQDEAGDEIQVGASGRFF